MRPYLFVLVLILIIISSPASADVLCTYKGSENSQDLLQLADFTVQGSSALQAGDSIVVSFKLKNIGQSDLKLGTRGFFAAARDPDNVDTSFGFSYAYSTIKPGETLSVNVSRTLDKAGSWLVWPSYQLSFSNMERLGPEKWHACSLIVSAAVKDSDQDGIVDDEDNCPYSYNLKQGDIDGDGKGDVCDPCDDRDSDGDAIKNCLDKCLAEKETFNNYQDEDGCPDSLPEATAQPSPTAAPSTAKPSVDISPVATPDKFKEQIYSRIDEKGKEDSGNIFIFTNFINGLLSTSARFFQSILEFFMQREVEIMPAPDFYLIKVTEKTKSGDYYGEITPEFDPTFNTTVVFSIAYSSNFSSQRIGETSTLRVSGSKFEVKGILREKEGRLEVINWTQNASYERAFRIYREALFLRSEARRLAKEITEKVDTVPSGRNLCLPSVEMFYAGVIGDIAPLSEPIDPLCYIVPPEEVVRRAESKHEHINDTINCNDGLAELAEKVRNATICPEEVEQWLREHPDVVDRVIRYDISELEVSPIAIYGEMRDTATRTIFPNGVKNRVGDSLRDIDHSISYIKDLFEDIFTPPLDCDSSWITRDNESTVAPLSSPALLPAPR
jgi:hypothetical protein